MSETEAIAKMSEILSNDIFPYFRWNSIGAKILIGTV